ncbi:MAG: hypothetical protein KME05_18860 [Gloeocapsa sp. UFS-A4-WI-NPMV-4B04]|nr:hypothetical protein [Gloeocapsa sp. UFS-A4-WI-NPMV-4B04]
MNADQALANRIGGCTNRTNLHGFIFWGDAETRSHLKPVYHPLARYNKFSIAFSTLSYKTSEENI